MTIPTAARRTRSDGWFCEVTWWADGASAETWHWTARVAELRCVSVCGATARAFGPRDEPPPDADVCGLCRYDADGVLPDMLLADGMPLAAV